MDKEEKKLFFRKKAYQKLKKSAPNNYKKDKFLISKLIDEINYNQVKDIMLFIPLKSEPNIYPLIKVLRQKGYNLYVPFIKGDTFKLVKFRLPLKTKQFGIKEPNNSYYNIKRVDIAIVPLLGVDKSFRRVGFGKGMYDRFYSKFGKKINKTIFLQRDILYTDEIVTNNYDISADKLITNSLKKIWIMNLFINKTKDISWQNILIW